MSAFAGNMNPNLKPYKAASPTVDLTVINSSSHFVNAFSSAANSEQLPVQPGTSQSEMRYEHRDVTRRGFTQQSLNQSQHGCSDAKHTHTVT